MKQPRKKPKTKPYYCKFYLTEDELKRLNDNVVMTHFNRSVYLDFMIHGIQVKEKLPDDLNDLRILLTRLYCPLQELQRLTDVRFPSVCKRIADVISNMGHLLREIYDTFGISDEVYIKTEDILQCVNVQNK